jgi:hypothetical protein
LPVPDTLLGALDLFAFSFLVIFGNVLDFRTYTNARGDPLEDVSGYDQNGIAVEERINICQARGVGLELLRWWNAKYTTEGCCCSAEGAFTTHLLMTQAAAVLHYKRLAQQDSRVGAPGCTLFMLTRQIENVLSLVHPGENRSVTLPEWWIARRGNSVSGNRVLGFSNEDWAHIKIKKRNPPQHYGKHYSTDTCRRDLTPSQRHPETFSPLVLHHSTRQSWNTPVLWCRRCAPRSGLKLNQK